MVYFSSKIQANGTPTHTSWSPLGETNSGNKFAGVPLLAVAFSDGALGVYTEDGEPLDPRRPLCVPGDRGEGVSVSCIEWHPHKTILAVAHTDGCLKLWSPHSKRAAENAVKHSSRSIDAMSWSNDGATLCTGDNTGYVSIWQVDDRTRPVFKCDVEVPEQLAKKKCKVTHISQTPTSFLKKNDDTSSSPATSFLITYQSHERGSLMRCVCVFGADTTEDSFCHAVTLFETETTIETVLVDDGFGKNENKKGGDKNTPAIVTLSADASLTRHASGDSSKIIFDETRVAKKQHQSAQWTQTCNFKLPVDSVSFETVCVAHANVVAVVSVNDPSCAIRMFDLVDGSMFFLRPFPELVGDESVKNKTQKPDRDRTEAGGAKRRLTCVVRDSVTGALACGGGDGTIVVFKPTGGERDTGDDLGKHAMAGLGVKNIMNSPGHRPRKGRRAMTSPGKSENTLESHGATGDAEARDGSGRDDDDGVTGDLKKPDQDPARGWRFLATTTTDAAVTSLRFAPGPSSKVLVATVFREHSGGTREAADSGNTGSTAKKNQNQSTGVLVLSKTRLADKVRQNVSLAHVSASALLVESTTGKFDPRLFRSSGGSVFGADSTDTCLLLWTAKHAETHVFGEHGYEKVARFPHHPPVNAAEVPHGISVARKTLVGGATATRSFIGAQTMALSGCGRVVYRPGRGAGVVEACELSGSSRDVLGFESTHGVCSHLDVNGEFLVCATSVGWVHLWWLGGRSPVTHGAADGTCHGMNVSGSNTSNLDHRTVETIRVNFDGSKVLVVWMDKRHGACREVGVYCIGSDSWSEIDLRGTTGRLVENAAWDCVAANLFVVQTVAAESWKDASGNGHDQSSGISERRFEQHANTPGVVAFTCFSLSRDRTESPDVPNTTPNQKKIVLQESHLLPTGFESVLGSAAPRLFVRRKENLADGDDTLSSPGFGETTSGVCFSIAMSDFEGIDTIDEGEEREKITQALLLFHEALASCETSPWSGDGTKNENGTEGTEHSGTTSRNSDLAFAAAKQLTHPIQWECASRQCVRLKRLDVAEMCLANMGHVRGARAARDAVRIPEPDARVAAVATHLGLLDEAKRLYVGCGRYDLLCELYRASGRWQEAIDIAQTHDRLHLRATHFAFGKHLESLGDAVGAIEQFEKAGRAHREVPRLLSSATNDFAFLESYIENNGSDHRLAIWKGKYLESQGELEKALGVYLERGSFLDATRVYVSIGDLDGAADCVCDAEQLAKEDALNPGNPVNPKGTPHNPSNPHNPEHQTLTSAQAFAACAFHLARAYEARGVIGDAIVWFGKAGRCGHATRLAMAHNMDGAVFDLAMKAPAGTASLVARFFLKRDDPGKAVALFVRAGNVQAAAELCFKHDLFQALVEIADSLLKMKVFEDSENQHAASSVSSNEELLKRCAAWFAEKGRFDHAVLCDARGGNFSDALKLAVLNDVPVTETLAETLLSGASGPSVPPEKKKQLTLDIAKLCKRQGAYQLSAKLYATAGERSKAMRCLLKTGDPEKVVFFANVSRDRESFIMAGNFLQTLGWGDNRERDSGNDNGTVSGKDGGKTPGAKDYTKNIVSFYTKAKAFGHLAGFHEGNAESEIDEFRDYDKALVHLELALAVRVKEAGVTTVSGETTDAKTDEKTGDKSDDKTGETTPNPLVDRVNLLERSITHVKRFRACRVSLRDASRKKKTVAEIFALADDVAALEKASAEGGHKIHPPPSLRVGDLFAMLVEHAYGVDKDAAAAFGYLETMKARGIQIVHFVDDDLTRDIARDVRKECV